MHQQQMADGNRIMENKALWDCEGGLGNGYKILVLHQWRAQEFLNQGA